MKKLILSLLLVCQTSQVMATSFVEERGLPLLRRTQSAPSVLFVLDEAKDNPADNKGVPCLKSTLKLSARVIGSGGFALGMMTIYGQSLEEMNLYLGEGIYPLMAGTAFFYGLTSFLSPLFEEKNTVPISWKVYSALQALLPVSLLLDAEVSHHEDARNQGWDKYFTYFMAIAPFVLWAEFQDNLSLGKRYFLNETGQAIRALDGYSDEEITELYEGMEQWGYYLPLPSLVETKQQTWASYVLPVLLPLFNAPLSVLVYQRFLGNILREDFAAKEGLLLSLAIGMAGASVMIDKQILSKERWTRFHLAGLTTGLFEAFPFLVQASRTFSTWTPFFQYPAVAFFSGLKVMTYGVSGAYLTRNLMGRSPCYRNTPQQKRLLLRDKLQNLHGKDL